MPKTLNYIAATSFVLYADESKKSELASRYMKEIGLKFDTRIYIDGFVARHLLFSSFDAAPHLPILHAAGFSRSFADIKNLLRAVVFEKLDVEYEQDAPKNLAFYNHWDYSAAKVTKIITCFDEQGHKIHEGDIDKAPHPLKTVLDRHDFKSWHEVASWEIGSWQKLEERIDDKGRIVDIEKRLIFFPDDIDALKSGNAAVATDSRSIYHVTYQAYFTDRNKLYRLYANMFD
jgi:hypothetical protein